MNVPIVPRPTPAHAVVAAFARARRHREMLKAEHALRVGLTQSLVFLFILCACAIAGTVAIDLTGSSGADMPGVFDPDQPVELLITASFVAASAIALAIALRCGPAVRRYTAIAIGLIFAGGLCYGFARTMADAPGLAAAMVVTWLLTAVFPLWVWQQSHSRWPAFVFLVTGGGLLLSMFVMALAPSVTLVVGGLGFVAAGVTQFRNPRAGGVVAVVAGAAAQVAAVVANGHAIGAGLMWAAIFYGAAFAPATWLAFQTWTRQFVNEFGVEALNTAPDSLERAQLVGLPGSAAAGRASVATRSPSVGTSTQPSQGTRV